MEKHYCATGHECPNVYCSQNQDWIHRLEQGEQVRQSEALVEGECRIE